MILSTLLVFMCVPYFTLGQTKRDIENNPNDFHMFENFELTKSLYVNETKIMIKLKLFFEKEEGGSRASSDSEGEIFSSSSAAEGERGNLYFNAIELFRSRRG